MDWVIDLAYYYGGWVRPAILATWPMDYDWDASNCIGRFCKVH